MKHRDDQMKLESLWSELRDDLKGGLNAAFVKVYDKAYALGCAYGRAGVAEEQAASYKRGLKQGRKESCLSCAEYKAQFEPLKSDNDAKNILMQEMLGMIMRNLRLPMEAEDDV